MTDQRPKVVPIKPVAGGAKSVSGADSVSMSSSSAPLVRLQERGRTCLQQYVQALFDQADDALFELADRATSNAEQNIYFESMREIRIQRRGIEQALMRGIAEDFRCLSAGIAIEDTRGDRSVDSLTLMDHDQLEESVAVDGMIAKAEKEFGESLVMLTARIDSLLTHAVVIKTNPFGPTRLCLGFAGATSALNLDIKAKLVLLKLFDRHVLGALGALYETLNELLVREGVLPQLRRSAANAQRSSAGAAAAEDGDAERVFRGLQQLLGRSRPEMEYFSLNQPNGLVAPGLAPALPRDALMQLLEDIQQQQIVWLARQHAAVLSGIPPQQLDVLQELNRALQQRIPDRPVSIGQIDDDAINLVSMLFQFVLEDRNLAAPMKGLIARLQIPILKVAMLDKSFFSRGGHPARKLLNEIANASLGWAPINPSADIERDPFYAKVEVLIARVIDEFVDDVAVFQSTLEDFIAFVEMDRRRASLVEQRTIDAEDGRAKSELARSTVQELLNQKVAGRHLPPVVVRLLQDGWSNVLFLICLREGVESESWSQGVQTIDDLLESVAPVDGLADRSRLLRMLPTLLKNLRSGLNKIGFNPFDLNQLFADLEQIHLQRLKKDDGSEVAPALEAVVEQPVAEIVETAAATQFVPVEKTLDEVLQGRQRSAAEEETAAEASESSSLADLDRELAEHFGEEPAVVGAPLVPARAELSESATVAEPAVTEGANVEPIRNRAEQAADRISSLQVGNWVEFQQAGGKVLRCRLAAIIRATGKYIFVNRAGVKVAENNRDGLQHAYLSGELMMLDEGRLFDRALESVIGNLREMKTRPSN